MTRRVSRVAGISAAVVCAAVFAGTTLRAQPPGPPFYQSLAWSPDSKQITFCAVLESWDDGYAVYVQNADGTARRALTEPGEAAMYPAWSPDGKSIAFGAGKAEAAEIYVVDVASGRRTRLTQNDTRDAGPSWSPDGQYIAFYSKRDGNSEIYVMGADGTEPRRLTTNDLDDWNPVWSPRGDALVYYATRREDGVDDLCILRFPAEGKRPDFAKARATTLPVTGVFPTWSHDGGHILYSDRHGDEQALFRVRADGSERTLLQENAFYGAGSPDGSRLAYVSRESNAAGERRYAILIRPIIETRSE